MNAPTDLIQVGHISGAYGIRGWVRVQPYSFDAESLLTIKKWWIDSPEMHVVNVKQCKDTGDELHVQFVGISDRNVAESLKGAGVFIERKLFPQTEEDEYYWVDLIGLPVLNQKQELLGVVSSLIDNGVHQVLIIKYKKGDKLAERLIPFVNQYIKHVDLKAKQIIVDWELDY